MVWGTIQRGGGEKFRNLTSESTTEKWESQEVRESDSPKVIHQME
jgi:hypothetical protein